GFYYRGRKLFVFRRPKTNAAPAEERTQKKGTAYITDIGMTGAADSVLGRKSESVIRAFRTQMPYSFEVAASDVQINGIIVTVDSHKKTAEHIERVVVKEDTPGDELTYDSDDGRPDYTNGF
ncbi:MAG: YmdB family metallophosphoesterase, partial [Planctomycetes bacterium]|nr:YmdB family metallophosphoesterase [Planctomycetota bacterium]